MKTREELDAEYEVHKSRITTPGVDLYEVEVILNDDEDKAYVFLKTPDRITINATQKMLNNQDPLVGVETFIKMTYVGGDDLDLVVKNDYALRSLDSVLGAMLYVKQSTLKKK